MQEFVIGYLVFIGLLIVYFLWMAACRPEALRMLREQNREHRERMLGGAWKVGKIAWRLYSRRR